MWKTFFTSSMIRMGHGLVDQMRDMVSLLSIELKNQPCICKGNEPETEKMLLEVVIWHRRVIPMQTPILMIFLSIRS
jgi:hypothetical protein